VNFDIASNFIPYEMKMKMTIRNL